MPKRVLAIGVGGSGKASLTILKERLEETYGKVPDNVVLLSFDTDELRDVDVFAGTQLEAAYDGRSREPEYRPVISRPGTTMNTIFADMVAGRTTSYMYWLEQTKLDKMLAPTERDIRGGAQQRRPIGRAALFQRWADPVYQAILEGVRRMYGEPESESAPDAISREKSKRVIFIIGSVAGGTGSGFLIDVTNLVRHAVRSNPVWQSVDISSIIVLPDAFSSYTVAMDDPTNLKPNSYAALRELDRFIRTHNTSLPYMIRYGDNLNSITWSLNQPVDQAYLVDTTSPGALGDIDLSKIDPMRGVFPLVADFMMAHVDQSLGDALATLRSNAGQHYNKEEGWQYSGFNVLTYIFPIDDVIESFSYRFLREMLARQYLPTDNKKVKAQIEQAAQHEVERIFIENTIGGKVNPNLIQLAIPATRLVDAESVDVSWRGLFNLLALSDTGFAEDYKDLEGWLTYLHNGMTPSKEGEHKHESYTDGYVRLTNFAEQYMNDCLGLQYDPDDEASRLGGEWDKILGRYPEALRQRFAEVVDGALLDVMNRRHPETKLLEDARLPYARALIAVLKSKLLRFREVITNDYRQLNLDERIRQRGQEIRDTLAWMYDTKDRTGFRLPIGQPEARKAQDSYIALFQERLEMQLHQRIYQMVIEILNLLGAEEMDKDNERSVLEQVALDLESWQMTFEEVDDILARRAREHDKNREEKRQVRVRKYLTNPQFEDQLYQRPQHIGAAVNRVLGQVRGEVGMMWRRADEDQPLAYKMVTMWTSEARGAEAIASSFFKGMKEQFQVIRKSVTVADRVEAEFSSPSSFVNVASQISDPFLRYNPATNGKSMFAERYISFNLSKAAESGQRFLEQARTTLSSQGYSVDSTAESLVACTVVEISRGVKLTAIDQFVACEPDYRTKLYQGRESLHLFPEEQVATSYEGRIEQLGEPGNRQRPLAPALVVAMGDEPKIEAFTMAAAYGLLRPDEFVDPTTGASSTELFLFWKRGERQMKLRLSQSRFVQSEDQRYGDVSAEEQQARLYLNALQNFVLLATEKQGVPPQMVANLVDDLKRQGVRLDHIDNPFTLSLREVNEAIRATRRELGPQEYEQSNNELREKYNASRCATRLQSFLQTKVINSFKASPATRVQDMGTVMHLILKKEIALLLDRAAGV